MSAKEHCIGLPLSTPGVYHCTGERKHQIEFLMLLEILDREFDSSITVVHMVLDNLKMHKGKLKKNPG
jgi:hypothetical protein